MYTEVYAMAKTTEAQKRAIERYEKYKVDRINARLPKGTKELILSTGASVNGFIIDAVNEKLASMGISAKILCEASQGMTEKEKLD